MTNSKRVVVPTNAERTRPRSSERQNLKTPTTTAAKGSTLPRNKPKMTRMRWYLLSLIFAYSTNIFLWFGKLRFSNGNRCFPFNNWSEIIDCWEKNMLIFQFIYLSQEFRRKKQQQKKTIAVSDEESDWDENLDISGFLFRISCIRGIRLD